MPAAVLLDRGLIDQILQQRRALGNRAHDEVWDGVPYIMPEPTNEHIDIAGFFYGVFWTLFGLRPGHRVQATPNLSDRVEDWTDNFRNPDFAYFSPETDAEDCGTHWFGGPDFLVEGLSPDDMGREKLPFYESISTREVLIVDRNPWRLELYQLRRGRLRLAGTAKPGDGQALASNLVPLSFALGRGRPRTKIRITHTETGQGWTF